MSARCSRASAKIANLFLTINCIDSFLAEFEVDLILAPSCRWGAGIGVYPGAHIPKSTSMPLQLQKLRTSTSCFTWRLEYTSQDGVSALYTGVPNAFSNPLVFMNDPFQPGCSQEERERQSSVDVTVVEDSDLAVIQI